MPIKRFLFFWLVDYVLATLVVYTLSSASSAVFDLPQLRYLSLVFIPLFTLFFSWLFYRSTDRVHAHRFVVASCWVGLALFVDALLFVLVYHSSPLLVFSSLSLTVQGVNFLAVFVGAYLGATSATSSAPIVADDMLSPR